MEPILKKSFLVIAVLLSGTIIQAQEKTDHLPIHQNKETKMETIQNSEKNKEAIRNLYENIMSGRKFELLKDLISDEYKGISGLTGPAAFQQQIAVLIKAFPNAKWHVLDIIAEGNKVIIRQQFRGTHQGEFQHIAPTGKFVSNTGTGFYEFKNRKIISSDIQTDRLSFLQQLGLIPADLTTLSVRQH